MNVFVTILLVAVAAVSAQHQQQLDPAYLRQYYAQAAQQGAPRASAPIFEPAEQQQHYQAAPAPKHNYPRPAQAQPHYVQEQRARQFAPQEHQQQQHYQQPQQQQYQQPRPQLKQKRPQQEEEEYDDVGAAYQFGFDVKDDEFTNYQNRKESRDNGVIKGSYSVVDSDGFLRTVNYVADPKEGFKAEVVREPTDIVVKIPPPRPQDQEAKPYKQTPPQQYRQQQHQQQQHQQARPEYSQYQQ